MQTGSSFSSNVATIAVAVVCGIAWFTRGQTIPNPDIARTAATSAAPAALARPIKGAGEDWSCFRGPRCGVSSWNNAPIDWDGGTGRGVVWKTPLATSCTSSPVVWLNHIYITEANHDERTVIAFDAENGKRLWRQVVPDGGGGVAVPSVADSALALPTPACDADGVLRPVRNRGSGLLFPRRHFAMEDLSSTSGDRIRIFFVAGDIKWNGVHPA